METKLPPHKAAAARNLAEKGRAKLVALKEDVKLAASVQNLPPAALPPHKAAGVRKAAEKEMARAQKAMADEAQTQEAAAAQQLQETEKVAVPTAKTAVPKPTAKMPYPPRHSTAIAQKPVMTDKAEEKVLLETVCQSCVSTMHSGD